MTCYLCETCGTEYSERASVPETCAVCSDERQYVRWAGQRWLTHGEHLKSHRNRIEHDAGLLGIGVTPSFAIDQRALIIPSDMGNILWESVSLVTDEALEALGALGGIKAIAISHPHFYSSMVCWSNALGGIPIYIHAADREWVMRPSAQIRFWEGDRLELSASVTLIHCPGHFPGSAALHWKQGVGGGGALFPGDTLQVVMDRSHVGFMYSYPNSIPLNPQVVRGLKGCFADLQYEDVYGFTWGRNIIGGAKKAVARSFDRYLNAVTPPTLDQENSRALSADPG